MGKFNLVTCRPPGFLHASAFEEVKASLGWALSALGHKTITSENAFTPTPDATNIIFGAELLAPNAEIPPNSIIYNLEQPSHPSLPNVRRLAVGKTVWDYSQHNLADWQAHGIPAYHVPIGYTPNLSRIPRAPVQDIDIFFAGWLTPRRAKLLDQLSQAGLKVIATDSSYGGGRDQLISRAKICLNLNHDNRTLFNIVRVSFLLANSKCVISETASDQPVYEAALEGAIEWQAYEDILDTCQIYLRSDTAREMRETQALTAIQQLDYIATIREALDPTSPSHHSTNGTLDERYLQGCQQGDMKDFLPTLRSLSKGEVLEIGVRDGASTSALLLGIEDKSGHLTSIDIQDCSHLWTHPLWEFHQQDSKTCQFPSAHFDLAFIDGDHSAEGFRADLENCLTWVKPGGIILCHDISPLPNYTQEARGGDWPSQFVGEEFFRIVREHKLRYLIYPGTWGLGMIIL